jgi:hypothetical protein
MKFSPALFLQDLGYGVGAAIVISVILFGLLFALGELQHNQEERRRQRPHDSE